MSIRPVRRYRERAAMDPSAKRYFVYTISDESGRPLYVGRSCNVVARIRDHHSSLTHPGKRSATWILDARSVSLEGPFTWAQVVAAERDTIERLQPAGNIAMTSRDWRPGIAARSARRAEA